MSWTNSNPVSIGAATKKGDYDKLWDNADYLKANMLPMGWLSGLAMTNAADTDHDITIAAGKCRDSTDAVDMVLASALTKQGDAAWAVGTNAGAMDTGSLPSAGTIHVWLIKRSDTGVVDALFSISATAPTMPANYDYKRLVGSYRTVVTTGHIINGDWFGTGVLRTFMFDTPILDVNNATPGTNAVTAALSTPGGIAVEAIFNVFCGVAVYVSALCNADMAPSITVAPLATAGQAVDESYGNSHNIAWVFTDTSSQIRYRIFKDLAFRIATLGWRQFL